MEKFFKLKENKTTVGTEIIGGLTTFFAMAYIIFVNPTILNQFYVITGQTEMATAIASSVFVATCLSAFVGTLLMAVYAKLPFAQASGMGLNAFFAYTVMLGSGYSFNQALAIVFIYLIMVAQFQSLMSPFIVMFTIPLAFTGGLLALLVTGKELSIIAMLGFLVLSGVVVNNGIVFVDSINQLRLEGMTRREAIVKTGRTRIRPVLMTALTTILAMSTMALGVGQGAEMTQPMAIVTIGGLSYATLLTLVIVPILYDIMMKRPLHDPQLDDAAEDAAREVNGLQEE